VLYAKYGPLIRAHCARLLRDPIAAEDALHEVFLRVRRHQDCLPSADGLRPWLLRVATNQCLNELRHRNTRDRNAVHWGYLDSPSPEELTNARNHVTRLLGGLPPQAQAVVWLTHVDGLLQREVAKTLGVSRRTVVNHLSRLRECAERP
jgi:RNA polymerase sigma-70 factor (ECF subfamily)